MMEELKYINLPPKEEWPKSHYGDAKESEKGEHGEWYDYINIDRRNTALIKLKTTKDQCLKKGTNIKRLVIEYSGYGDSGDEFFAFVDNKKKHKWDGYPGGGDSDPDMPELSKILNKDAEDIVFDGLFQLLPGGWEINEGSFGHLIWDIAEDEVQILHNWNRRTHEEDFGEAKLNFEGI